jgi:hypothetical protein
MKKMRSLFLVLSVAVMLSAFSVAGSRFNYYMGMPAMVGQPMMMMMPMGQTVGAGGMSAYYSSLVAKGSFALAAF